MKNLLLIATVFAASMAFAKPAKKSPREVSATINYVSCGSINPAYGSTSVTYSGVYDKAHYFNVTNVNPFGATFTEQAKVVGVFQAEKALHINLETVVTKRNLTLQLENESVNGLLAEPRGSGIPLTCATSIEIQK